MKYIILANSKIIRFLELYQIPKNETLFFNKNTRKYGVVSIKCYNRSLKK
jgi:hypothetical protein